MKIMLTISYDGTDFHGWQKQKNGRSVQEITENAIKEITGKTVKLVGSGRTDAGVHAEGQVASFEINELSVPAEKLFLALNTVLPDDVKVIESRKTKDDFDASRSAKRKTYRYSMYKSRVILPLCDRYATRISERTDVEKMRSATKAFIGEHDFKAFCATGSSAKTTVREIYDIRIEEKDNFVNVYVTGNGFLYNMVRIIVGTLLSVGEGKLTEEDVFNAVNFGDKNKRGKTAPAKGLCLTSVVY